MSRPPLPSEDLMQCIEALTMAWFSLADSLISSGVLDPVDLEKRMLKAEGLKEIHGMETAITLMQAMREGIRP